MSRIHQEKNSGEAWDKWRKTLQGERFDLPAFVSPKRMNTPSLEYCESYPDYAKNQLRPNEIAKAEYVFRDQPEWDYYYGSGRERVLGQQRAYKRQKARELAERENGKIQTN